MTERDLHIVYPDDYKPTERQVRNWYSDAVANGEIHGSLNPDTAELESIVMELHESGLFTFVRPGLYHHEIDAG